MTRRLDPFGPAIVVLLIVGLLVLGGTLECMIDPQCN